tara:strand:+ start:1338 stop:2207 length:870 start_codon:yes stop_codon:yes gene_type:complete
MVDINKTAIGFAAFGIVGMGVGASFFGLADGFQKLKPLEGRFNEIYGVLTDSRTGDIFYSITGSNGEQRLVKFDNISETKVRKELNEKRALLDENDKLRAQLRNAQSSRVVAKNNNDVRSGKIFEKNTLITKNTTNERNKIVKTDYNINTRIKYRAKERSMLYRVAISTEPKKGKCLSFSEEKALKNTFNSPSNKITLRFADSDKFWLQDSVIPLSIKSGSNNRSSTIIDSEKPEGCSSVNTVVFHGRFFDFSFPDYTWVEDGKLVFKDTIFDDKLSPNSSSGSSSPSR